MKHVVFIVLNPNTENKTCEKAFVCVANRNKIPKQYYSFGKLKEEAACIIYEEGHWSVFIWERGTRQLLKTYESPFEATLRMIEIITDNDEDEERLKKEFKREYRICVQALMIKRSMDKDVALRKDNEFWRNVSKPVVVMRVEATRNNSRKNQKNKVRIYRDPKGMSYPEKRKKLMANMKNVKLLRKKESD